MHATPHWRRHATPKNSGCRILWPHAAFVLSLVFSIVWYSSRVQCATCNTDQSLTNDILYFFSASLKYIDCIFYFYLGGIGAKRFCSSLDLGNYCNYVKQPGDILTYRTCVFTCTGDGCNPSNVIKPNNLVIAIVVYTIFQIVNQVFR